MIPVYRSDSNQKAIVKALRDAGCVVWLVQGVRSAGFPDLVAGRDGVTYLLEVKRPKGPRGGTSHSELNDDQVRFAASWTGGPFAVVRSVDEALAAVGLGVG